MTIRLTMFFQLNQQTRTYGWSETCYLGTQSVDYYINGNAPEVDTYINVRQQMLAAGVTNTFNRISDVSIGLQLPGATRRNAFILTNNFANLAQGAFNALFNPAIPQAEPSQVNLMLRMFSSLVNGVEYVRTFWVSGVPDAGVSIKAIGIVEANFKIAFTQWKNQVLTGAPAFQLRCNDRSTGNPLLVCTGYAPATGQFTVPGNNFVNGQRVEALGFKGIPGSSVPRGVYKVVVVSAGVFTLQTKVQPTGFSTLGNFRALSYIYPPVTYIADRAISYRKKGRPFSALPGRRPTPRTSRS